MRYLSSLVALILMLTGCSSFISSDIPCQQSDITIDFNFDNARVNDCKLTGDNEITILITPENSPINNSPWYAFKASSATSKQISVQIKYQGGDHRYQPKLSVDGQHWQSIAHSAGKTSLSFDLSVGPKPVFVAGQEIINNEDYHHWMSKLALHDSVEYSILGQSSQQRDIGQLEITASGNEWIVILGRQHPPEVTGALALFPFVEYILQDSSLTTQFRKRFNILVIPDLNPDGVALGNWRHNANGVDLNRDWKGFAQVESRLVRDKLEAITAHGGKIVFAVDFHSTHNDIFYTMPSDYGVNPPKFVEQWLGSLAQQAAPFVVTQKPGNNPDKGVFKQYIADKYRVHAITYEMGDSTDRDTIATIAEQAGETLMTTLLATPAKMFDSSEAQ